MDRGELLIRIAGSGGQGIILAGVILGNAAVIDGFHCCFSTSYGSQARGGESAGDLIVSESEIDYPHVELPSILVAMSQRGYDASAGLMGSRGVVFYDSYFVSPEGGVGAMHFKIPATASVVEKYGRAQGANIFMLGSVAGFVSIISDGAFFESFRINLKAGYYDVSKRIFLDGKNFFLNMKHERI